MRKSCNLRNLRFLFEHRKPYQFYLCRGIFDDLELIIVELDHLVELGERLVDVENESAERHIFVALRQFKVEEFVDLADLQTCGEDVFVVGELLGHVVGAVVLVLDLTSDLLHDVLEGDEAAGASELVDDNGEGAFLLHELLHQA